MEKYNSKFTGEQLDTAVGLLDKSWIQVEISNGIPNEDVILTPGKKYIATNAMPQMNYFHSKNSATFVNHTTASSSYPLYLNYSNFSVTSSKALAGIYMNILPVAGHIYYFRSFIDGVNSNGILHGMRVENSNGTVYLSYSTTSLDAEEVSMYGVINSNSAIWCFYSNLSNTAGDSTVLFGRDSFIDLTYTFGAGNEPSKEWCDNNICFYGENSGYRSSIILDDPQESDTKKFDIIKSTFDNSGKCIVSLPGFDNWTASSNYIEESSKVVLNSFYDHVNVDKVKRYYIELPYIEKYTNGTNIMVPLYGAISAESFVVYLYYEVDNHLVNIRNKISQTVKYYIFIRETGQESWNYYKNYINNSNKCVRSGTMEYSDVIKTYYAHYSSALTNADYICFSIVSGYDTVVS